jgi:cell division inhibitor SulA
MPRGSDPADVVGRAARRGTVSAVEGWMMERLTETSDPKVVRAARRGTTARVHGRCRRWLVCRCCRQSW